MSKQLTLYNQLCEPTKEVVALRLGNLIDALSMMANGVHTLPPSDWVRPDDGVSSLQVCPDILRGTALSAVQLEVVLLGTLIEDWLSVRSSEAFQELLVCRRQAIVNFVTGRPKRVTTSLWQLGQSKDGIVTRHGFESNVAMPALLAALLLISRKAFCIQLLRLLGADDGDLIIFTTECAATVGDRMDVKLGGARLA